MTDEKSEPERDLVDELTGALRFIMAFYVPGQTYLDTEAWKHAEAGGWAALARGEAELASPPPAVSQEGAESEDERVWLERHDKYKASFAASEVEFFDELEKRAAAAPSREELIAGLKDAHLGFKLIDEYVRKHMRDDHLAGDLGSTAQFAKLDALLQRAGVR